MPFLTSSSVVLITASSAGLGAATARAFAIAGARVVINYHSRREPAESLLQELSQLAPNAPSTSNASTPRFLAIQCDATSRDDLNRLVSETVTAMGRLDVVVSNQGWTRIVDFFNLDENVEDADWDRCFNANVKSHLFLFHAANKHLDATQGAFITTASLAGVVPSGSSLAYSVTKAALIYLSKALAMIAGPNIRVNSVSPGVLLTDWGRQFSPERLQKVTDKSALKRFATVEDVSQQILLFANSQSVTGSNSVIDAGFSL